MSSEVKERIEAINQLRDNFAVLPDKKQAAEGSESKVRHYKM